MASTEVEARTRANIEKFLLEIIADYTAKVVDAKQGCELAKGFFERRERAKILVKYRARLAKAEKKLFNLRQASLNFAAEAKGPERRFESRGTPIAPDDE